MTGMGREVIIPAYVLQKTWNCINRKNWLERLTEIMLKKALQSLCWNYKKKLEVGYEKAAASASTDIGMPVSGMDYDIAGSGCCNVI